MINSFNGDMSVADAIAFVFSDNLCVIDDKWYKHNNRWIESHNPTTDIISEFIMQYDVIEKFIVYSDKILEIEKYDYLDQINQLKNNFLNEKKNKSILSLLKKQIVKEKLLDIDRNLFSFNNGFLILTVWHSENVDLWIWYQKHAITIIQMYT